MNAYVTDRSRWPWVAAILVTGVASFLAARWTAPSLSTPAENPAAPRAPATRNTLELDATHLGAVGITLDIVTPGSLTAEIRAPATIVAAPNGQAIITARSAGTISRIVKRLGDAVRTGETLALVESRDAAGIAAKIGRAHV